MLAQADSAISAASKVGYEAVIVVLLFLAAIWIVKKYVDAKLKADETQRNAAAKIEEERRQEATHREQRMASRIDRLEGDDRQLLITLVKDTNTQLSACASAILQNREAFDRHADVVGDVKGAISSFRKTIDGQSSVIKSTVEQMKKCYGERSQEMEKRFGPNWMDHMEAAFAKVALEVDKTTAPG